MKNKRKKGFTLIELLIVIGIIAILAAAVIIAINPGQQFKQARNATRWSHMNSVVNATYSYMISEAGAFPSCLYDGTTPITGLIDISLCEGDLKPDHIGDLPGDPQLAGTTWSDPVTGFTIDGVSGTYTIAACTSGCKGYLIGFASLNRIIVASKATEAFEEGIAVVQ